MNGKQAADALGWDRPLRYRRGAYDRLAGIAIYFDFDWRSVFHHNRSVFPRGQSLSKLVLRECPEGKTPRLLLTERIDVQAGFHELEKDYFVIVSVHDYLNNAGADAASSYYARLSGTPLIQLATLADIQFSAGDLGNFLDVQLTPSALANWLGRSPGRIQILRDLVGSEADTVPVDIAAALRQLEVEDVEILQELANYVTRIGDGSRLLRAILSQEGGEDLIRCLIDEGTITSVDIVNTAYRKRQLEIFEKMLADEEYWKEYALSESISDSSEEKIWQHFFYKNDWIFGYGLDYRFNGVLQKEFHASGTQADGSESVITDFLLGDKRFTTFVEIKKPSTAIFGNSQNRSNSWRLSNDLVDGVSQILEHKASGQIKIETQTLFDEGGTHIVQKSHDSKVILVIGDWTRVTVANDLEKQIKEKTFELYRRDSRNIKMLTYDELLERARFIVQHKATKTDNDSRTTAI